MTRIKRSVFQYSLTPEGAHYWSLEELVKAENLKPRDGYWARLVDIHEWVNEALPFVQKPVEGYQRLFIGNGNTAHLVADQVSPSSGIVARCGMGPMIGDSWRGTGSQEERDRMARMNDCKTCTNILKQDAEAVRRANAEITARMNQ